MAPQAHGRVMLLGVPVVTALGVRQRVVRQVRRGPQVVVTHAPAEALAQGQFGRQLPDLVPLVQDGLLLLDQALP